MNFAAVKNVKTLAAVAVLGTGLISFTATAGDGDKNGLQKVSKKELAETATIGMLSVSNYTNADLKVVKRYRYDESPQQVFSYISKSENIPQYIKQVKAVEVDHSNEDDMGVGCTRQCSFGGTAIDEEIVYVEPNKVFAYRVKDNDMVSNHLAVIHLEEVDGGTVMTWYQYFDKGAKGMKSSMMKMMMGGILKGGMKEVDEQVSM